jgi:hypothetical protein
MGNQMAKKKERAFFVCPRWNEVADVSRVGSPAVAPPNAVHPKTLAAIRQGQPLARSTLRKALMAVRHAYGSMFDIDAYIVDRRTAPSP